MNIFLSKALLIKNKCNIVDSEYIVTYKWIASNIL